MVRKQLITKALKRAWIYLMSNGDVIDYVLFIFVMSIIRVVKLIVKNF